jgi:hypothetical protein
MMEISPHDAITNGSLQSRAGNGDRLAQKVERELRDAQQVQT